MCEHALAAAAATEGQAQFLPVVEEVFFLAALGADAVRDLGIGAFDPPVVLAALWFLRLRGFAGTRAPIGLAFSHCNHPFTARVWVKRSVMRNVASIDITAPPVPPVYASTRS